MKADDEVVQHLLRIQAQLVMLSEDDTIPRGQLELIWVMLKRNHRTLSELLPGWTVKGEGEWSTAEQSKSDLLTSAKAML